MPPKSNQDPQTSLDVLQQFRVIYGCMRQYFREVEESCGLPSSQMWILQELQRTPGIGISDLACRMGVHQSTCSQLVDKLHQGNFTEKRKEHSDLRRTGLYLTEKGKEAICALPGPAEGLLPEALSKLPEVALKTLKINLDALITHLPGQHNSFAQTPLAEMLTSQRRTKPKAPPASPANPSSPAVADKPDHKT